MRSEDLQGSVHGGVALGNERAALTGPEGVEVVAILGKNGLVRDALGVAVLDELSEVPHGPVARGLSRREGGPVSDALARSAVHRRNNIRIWRVEQHMSVNLRSEEVESIIYQAIEDFNFGGYGMDDVDEVIGMDWHVNLAARITRALEQGTGE
jgi:hypothetical protein